MTSLLLGLVLPCVGAALAEEGAIPEEVSDPYGLPDTTTSDHLALLWGDDVGLAATAAHATVHAVLHATGSVPLGPRCPCR